MKSTFSSSRCQLVAILALAGSMICSPARSQGIVEAVEKGDYARVKHFLDQDCSLAATNPDPVLSTHFGNLINLATSLRRTSIVRMLIDCGVGPDTRSATGGTPIIWSAMFGDSLTVRLLLDRGAAVDISDGDGETPLHGAAAGGYVSIARMLLAAGASRDARDNSGNRPEDYAVQGDHTELALLLRQYVRPKTTFEQSDSIATVGDEFFEQADYRNALMEYNTALHLVSSSKLLWKIGVANDSLGEVDKAMDYYQSSIARYSPDESFNPHWSRALLLIRRGRNAEAKADFDYPGCRKGFSLLGDLARANAQYVEAADLYASALGDGKYYPALLGKAITLDSLGMDSAALVAYQQAQETRLNNKYDQATSFKNDETSAIARLEVRLALRFLTTIDSLDLVGQHTLAYSRLIFCDTCCPSLRQEVGQKRGERALRWAEDSMRRSTHSSESSFLPNVLDKIGSLYSRMNSQQQQRAIALLSAYYKDLGNRWMNAGKIGDAISAFDAGLAIDHHNDTLRELRERAMGYEISPFLAGSISFILPGMGTVYAGGRNALPAITFGLLALGSYAWAWKGPDSTRWIVGGIGLVLHYICIAATVAGAKDYNEDLLKTTESFRRFEFSLAWLGAGPALAFSARF